MMDSGAVEFAEPDYSVAPVKIANDTLYTEQWHHEIINSPQAWDDSTDPPGLSCSNSYSCLGFSISVLPVT